MQTPITKFNTNVRASSMKRKNIRNLFYGFLLSLVIYNASAQDTPRPVYNSLLWEISGNGLSRPSFLFGTMHVSSKLAFHLSDSFYYAMRNVDAVALELNPELWQPQMASLNDLNLNYTQYVQYGGNGYLSENSFKIEKFSDPLLLALNSEPPVVNSLLYRSYKAKEDFEEDTFLDLYIYQTGRKLGKSPAGVEDFYESQKLVMEAYADMAKEKKKKEIDLDGETISDIQDKIQEAYKRGDLSLMDSLDNKMERSTAFREKFLLKRNEIQAHSIDSIIKKKSLFVGVGAAHLPGARGVIELLRSMGYTLRPIKMSNRDARQKDEIEKVKVKVNFTTQYAADSTYSVDVPGPLYFLPNAYMPLNRWQFADMNNGSYYMVTRVKTNAGFLKMTDADVLRKIDSVLYENIPGKIISKKSINNNGYPGYEINNRTRRGDLQRYQIFVLPAEIVIFKMSGKNDYVAGEEANRFFNSIQLKKLNNGPQYYKPVQGGFHFLFPNTPSEFFDQVKKQRWEYETIDPATGDAWLLMKLNNFNFDFIERDSFDLGLIEESFRSADIFDKQISRKLGTLAGTPALFVREKLKEGDFVNAVYLVKGPEYYVLARRTKNEADSSFDFANSFGWEPYHYPKANTYTDTFYRFSVTTPIHPVIDEGIRTIIEKSAEDIANGNNSSGYITYWPKKKPALFESDSTGQMIFVTVQQYPKYFSIKDSAKFWKNEIEEYTGDGDMLITHKKPVFIPGKRAGYRFTLQDTGSAKTIERMLLLQGNAMYSLVTMSDTLTGTNGFIDTFFNSFEGMPDDSSQDLYVSKLPLFFDDLFSKDSALHKKAQQSLTGVFFGPLGAPLLYEAINRINITDKDYFDTKVKLIAELGYIKDSIPDYIPGFLNTIYHNTADTSLFQNEAVLALSKLKTKTAYAFLKKIMMEDPPIFDQNESYRTLFNNLNDSLALSAGFFPEILQLTTLQDYKEYVTGLLLNMIDSGMLRKKDYEKYFPSIYIDAKVALRKQQTRDEKIMQANKEKEDASADDDNGYDRNYYYGSDNGLSDYTVLLMPFYEKDEKVRNFFKKLLLSKDEKVLLNTSVVLIKNNKDVPDSILQKLAANDKYRVPLYRSLMEIKRTDKFPMAFNNPLSMAKSILRLESDRAAFDSIVFLKKQITYLKDSTGMVYFFKYRVKKSDDWKLGISGLQPLDSNKVDVDGDLVSLTDKKIKEGEEGNQLMNEQLKKIRFSLHRSARYFYSSNSGYDYMNNYRGGDYEE